MKKYYLVVSLLLVLLSFSCLADTPSFLWPTTLESKTFHMGMFEDGQGGVITISVNVKEYGSGSPFTINKASLQARRISADGSIIWLTNINTNEAEGKILGGDSLLLAHGTLSSDKNYFIIASFGYLPEEGKACVKLQKLSISDGSKQWGTNGIILASTSESAADGVYITADDSGGALVAWAWQKAVYAQWIDRNGSSVLPGGAALQITSEATIGENNDNPMIAFFKNLSAGLVFWDGPEGKILGRIYAKNGYLESVSNMMILDGDFSSYHKKKDIVYAPNGDVLFALDIGAAAVIRINSDFSRRGVLMAQPGTEYSHLALSGTNEVLFSYAKSISPTEGSLYVYKSSINSLPLGYPMEYKVITTGDSWPVISPSEKQSGGPFYSLASDGVGGAIVVFTDVRNLTPSEVSIYANALKIGPSAEAARLDTNIYAQRISSVGSREFGETGSLVGNGAYGQVYPEAAAVSSLKTAVFSYVDASQSYDKGEYKWFAEASSKIQKVGPEIEKPNLFVDGFKSASGVVASSSKPTVSAIIGDPTKITSIKVYVNNELKFEKTSDFVKTNDFTLDLSQAGTYDVMVVTRDINGNESVISFALSSPGAAAVGLVEGMTVYPAPYVPTQGSATISYVLASDTDAQLVIMSPTGATPVLNQRFAAGTNGGKVSYNAVVWDGKLPSGDYAGTGIYPVKLFNARDGRELGKAYIVIQ